MPFSDKDFTVHDVGELETTLALLKGSTNKHPVSSTTNAKNFNFTMKDGTNEWRREEEGSNMIGTGCGHEGKKQPEEWKKVRGRPNHICTRNMTGLLPVRTKTVVRQTSVLSVVLEN